MGTQLKHRRSASLLKLNLETEGVGGTLVAAEELEGVEVSANGDSRARGPVLLEGEAEAEVLGGSDAELGLHDGVGSVFVLAGDSGSGGGLVGGAVNREGSTELDSGSHLLPERATNNIALVGVVVPGNNLPKGLEVASLDVPEERRSSLLLSLGVGSGEVDLGTNVHVLVGSNSGSLNLDGLSGGIIGIGDGSLDGDVLVLEVSTTLNRGASLVLNTGD